MLPKVYFCGSIRGGREYAAVYAQLIAKLSQHAHVLTEHVGSDERAGADRALDDRAIHDRDLAWLREASAVVAECTAPSLGVGYEIAVALAEHKPVLVLFRPEAGRGLSAMIAGAPGIEVVDYADPAEGAASAIAWLARVTAAART